MKRILMICFLTVGGTFSAVAQRLHLSPDVESTVAGLQYGLTTGWVFKGGLQIGAFYKTNRPLTAEGQTLHKLIGVESFLPLVKEKRLVFGMSARAGISNNRFIVVIPGITTLVRISDAVTLGTSMNLRFGAPATQLKLMFHI